jgi:hypothetical protein
MGSPVVLKDGVAHTGQGMCSLDKVLMRMRHGVALSQWNCRAQDSVQDSVLGRMQDG